MSTPSTGTASRDTSGPPRQIEPGSDARLAPLTQGRAPGWWGMVWLIATEAMLFAGVLSTWFFIRTISDVWPQGGAEPPALGRPGLFSAVLVLSALPLSWAAASLRRGRMTGVRAALAVSWLLGFAFLINLGFEYQALEFVPGDSAYASLFHLIVGLHGLHLVVALAMGAVVQLKAGTGRLGPGRHLTLQIFTLYWSFVTVAWLAVFVSLYVA